MTSPMGGFPRPSLQTIFAALIGGIGTQSTGYRQTGLGQPFFLIDVNGKFKAGAIANATRVDKLSMGFKSFSKPVKIVLDTIVIPSIIQNFAEQGSPKWKNLSKRTIKNRLYEGYPRGPILDKTGRLKKAASRKNNWEVQTHMLKFRAAFFTQSVRYAGFHQRGSNIITLPSGHMTAEAHWPTGMFDVWHHDLETGFQVFREVRTLEPRPFIQLTPGEQIEVYNVFLAFMNEQVDRYWGKGSNL